MNRADLLAHLTAAKRHVEESDSHIAAQRRIIADLTANGGDTAEAEKVLRMFEATVQNVMDEEGCILDALDKLPLFEEQQ